jgi:hypothetical protein
MADNTLRLSGKDGGSDKPAASKYVIVKYVYTAPERYPLTIGGVHDLAELSDADIQYLLAAGFIRRADDDTTSNAQVINANVDKSRTLAMPPSPRLVTYPLNPAQPLGS